MRVSVEWASCKNSGLIVPKDFIEDKEAMKGWLKKVIEETVEKNQHRHGSYFIVFHGRFDDFNPVMLRKKLSIREDLPTFVTNQIVFWVCNKRGILEWLWTVSPTKKIDFNKEGVAYLQAKGAMPTKAA